MVQSTRSERAIKWTRLVAKEALVWLNRVREVQGHAQKVPSERYCVRYCRGYCTCSLRAPQERAGVDWTGPPKETRPSLPTKLFPPSTVELPSRVARNWATGLVEGPVPAITFWKCLLSYFYGSTYRLGPKFDAKECSCSRIKVLFGAFCEPSIVKISWIIKGHNAHLS